MTVRWLLKQLALPPTPMILLLLVAVLIWRWRPRFARGLVVFVLVLFWASSTPVVVDPITRWWQDVPSASWVEVAQTDAIVVLGGGRIGNAREWAGQDQVNRHTLIRLRYGAHLARTTGLPLMVTGGSWPADRAPEAQLMNRALKEWGIQAKWLETQSLTTWDNAFNASAILLPSDIQRITLVTQAFHMRRAQAVFEKADFTVLPAATDYDERYITGQSGLSAVLLNWVPSGKTARDLNVVLYELLGMGVYALKDFKFKDFL